ncbi:hypothetical protein vseg_012612 [Gypsophila vaccaria]
MTISSKLLYYCLVFISLSTTTLSLQLPEAPPIIKSCCDATRYPLDCESMLTMLSNTGLNIPYDSNSSFVTQASFSATLNHLNTARSKLNDLLLNSTTLYPNITKPDKFCLNSSTLCPNIIKPAKSCLNSISLSAAHITKANHSLSISHIRDARAFVSAALSYQHDCSSDIKSVNTTLPIVHFLDRILIVSTSNALSMLMAMDTFGLDPKYWKPPKTERDGVWDNVDNYGLTKPGFNFSGLEVDATVCKEVYSSCYNTVQEAVDSAPLHLKGWKWYVIRIREGVYKEIVRVPYDKTNLVFLGDGPGKTVISGYLDTSLHGINVSDSATVAVLGDGFMASGITFKNSAFSDEYQAVAFQSSSDFSFLENCEFLGHQNTLHLHSLRQIYKSCHIEGTVNFIFGNAAAIFQDCTIFVRPRQVNLDKGESNIIAAHGRTDPAQPTGFVFLGCLINGTSDYMSLYLKNPTLHKNYLGSPLTMYSRTVYINNTLGDIISPEGWAPRDKEFALSTLFYGEFGNSGGGASVSKRVPWSTQIPQQYVSTYYAHNFVQANEWITLTS